MTIRRRTFLALTDDVIAALNRIHDNRQFGEPGNNAFCIIERGGAYVQLLAPPEPSILCVEAVSAKSDPAMVEIVTPQKEQLLAKLGFHSPGERSPNYWQEIEIRGDEDLRKAAKVAISTLRKIYNVADPGAVDLFLRLPGSPLVLAEEPISAGGTGFIVSGVGLPPTSKPSHKAEQPDSASPARYKVLVDDNFHFMNEEERWDYGVYDTYKAALAACKHLVDQSLQGLLPDNPSEARRMTAKELYELYKFFGDDPFIAVSGGGAAPDEKFSAWTYARERSRSVCGEADDEGGPRWRLQ